MADLLLDSTADFGDLTGGFSGGFCGRFFENGGFFAANFSNHDLNLSPLKFHRKVPRFWGAILQACRGQVGTQTGNGPRPSSRLICSLY